MRRTSALAGPDSPVGRLHLLPPVHVAPETSLVEVARLLREHGVSLAVVDLSEPAVVTERDLVGALAGGRSTTGSAGELATRHPVMVAASMPLAEAVAVMLDHGIRHLLVCDEAGRPIGTFSSREGMRILLRQVDPGLWEPSAGADPAPPADAG
ncbi:MAG TPA: CBS domain-containing protein [Acidimicrobiales bacterium]|nr:CBS domain-containing protein [Acidimicrobiales bacterium]